MSYELKKMLICDLVKQEAAALAATQVAFVLQSGQRRGLQFTVAPAHAVVAPVPPQEPAWFISDGMLSSIFSGNQW